MCYPTTARWNLTAADGTALTSRDGKPAQHSGAVLIVDAFAGHGPVGLPTYFVGEALPSGTAVDGA